MTSPFRVLDCFAGIGGFSLGLHATGYFETKAFCEIDPYAKSVLGLRFPGVYIHDDIKTLTRETLLVHDIDINVITGGFPCQDISATGAQAGLSADRSGLWYQLLRIIGEVRPRYAIVENVSNLLTGDSGRWFGTVLAGLAEIGYDAEWHCIQAANVSAAHIRDRVWIIAYSGQAAIRSRGGNGGLLHSGAWTSTEWRNGIFDAPCAPCAPYRMAPTEWYADSEILARRSLLYGKDDGVPVALDRLGCCGNAIVPQIAELIGNAIARVEGL